MNQPTLHPVLIALITAAAALVVVWGGLRIYGTWHDDWSGYTASTMVSDGWCNIAVLPVYGDIIPYSGADKDGISTESDLPPTTNPDDFSFMLRMAEADYNILGVLVPLDSYGGTPTASESISNALKRSALPSAAVVGEGATSGGYMIASGANVT